jgi:acyl-CoA-binding protein
MNMNATFEEVVTLVREKPVTAERDTTSNEEKLRLYGLYKHVTEGTCPGNSGSPSRLRPQLYAKYQAWLSCQHLSKDQAMKDYVLLAASQDNLLGRKCTEVWKNYNDSADAGAPLDDA